VPALICLKHAHTSKVFQLQVIKANGMPLISATGISAVKVALLASHYYLKMDKYWWIYTIA
jgi:hypothetical protein